LNNIDDIFEIQMDLMRMRRNIDSRIEPHPIRKADFNYSNSFAKEILDNGIKII
jgi:hypothetical protein